MGRGATGGPCVHSASVCVPLCMVFPLSPGVSTNQTSDPAFRSKVLVSVHKFARPVSDDSGGLLAWH